MTRESLSKTLASAPVPVPPASAPASLMSDPRASFSRVLARSKAYRAGALFSSLGITVGTAFMVATVGFDSPPWLVCAALAGLAAAGSVLVMTDLAVFALLELSAPTASAASSTKMDSRAHPAEVIPPFASEVISVRRAGRRIVVDVAPVEEADLIADELPDSSDSPLYSELAGDADLDGILAEFLETLGARAASLQAALAESDLPNLRRLAHQLKGAAGSYGFPTITEQAKIVEAALATNDLAKISRTVATLCSLCLRARNSGAMLKAGAA